MFLHSAIWRTEIEHEFMEALSGEILFRESANSTYEAVFSNYNE